MRTSALFFLAPLALVCGSAQALGLGQIQVKSKPGQPLLAEIPVVVNQPDELIGLRAQLASPETFQRVGLQMPKGLAADLNFNLAQDEEGLPVIRVTSNAPVDTPEVIFLMEINWGEGRIVREFSALIERPEIVNTAVPVIEDAIAAPSNLVTRNNQAVTVEEPQQNETNEETVPPSTTNPQKDAPQAIEKTIDANPEDVQAKEEQERTPPALTNEIIPTAPDLATKQEVPKRERVLPSATTIPEKHDTIQVTRGTTLSAIAKQIQPPGKSLNETMMALLRKNPDAFINGNIHQLRAGVILRTPSQETWTSEEVREANALVAAQTKQWQQWKASTVPESAQEIKSVDDNEAKAARTQNPATTMKEARLQIVPAASSENEPQGESGTSLQGKGDIRNNVEDAKAREAETLAVQNQEIEELQQKIQSLESLEQDQKKLLEMKNNQLTAIQQQLAKRQNKPKPKNTAQPPQQSETSTPFSPVWLTLGGGIVVLSLGIFFWRVRSRKRNLSAFLETEDEKNEEQL